jgi:hypothetical protein
VIPVGDDDETDALVARLELLLRARQAEGRCCHTDCLHCQYRPRDGWPTRQVDEADQPARP